MALRDWNIGSKPATPPDSNWKPLKEFIHYGYSKGDSSPPLSQNPPPIRIESRNDALSLVKTAPKKQS